jgi:hypothetical protein
VIQGWGSGSAASWPRSGPGWSRRARRPRSRRRDRPRARRRLHRDAVTEAVIFALAVLLAIGLGVVLVRISGRPAAQAPAAG